MIWARSNAAGQGNADASFNLMSAIAGDLGMTTMPPGSTIIRLLINMMYYFDGGTAGSRAMVFGIKEVPFNVVLPAVANFGPNLAQHSDWMWWYRAPKTTIGLAAHVSKDWDIRSARRMPEVESTLALYYQGDTAVALDSYNVSVSALIKLP